MLSESVKATFRRFFTVVIFGIAFAYIEAAVVVYLRAIFHPDGFTFPLTTFATGGLWGKLLLTEIGREAATLVIILTACWLIGRNAPQRAAWFLTIFAVWDIFYYVWLKVLINWPASIMDWDILFLMPVAWASPTLAPILVSLTMLAFAVVILYRDSLDRPLKVTIFRWSGFFIAALIIVASFCIAGKHMAEPDFADHFSWLLFIFGEILAIATFLSCALTGENAE